MAVNHFPYEESLTFRKSKIVRLTDKKIYKSNKTEKDKNKIKIKVPLDN